MSNILLWTPSYGRAKAGRTARTYVEQLCADTECNPEDLPEAMDDREGRGHPCWWRDVMMMMMMMMMVKFIQNCSTFFSDLYWLKILISIIIILQSFLLRCGTNTYETGSQWDSNSLVKVFISSLLIIIRPQASI